MNRAIASVYWLTSCEGGRKVLPQQGTMYYPHIVLVDGIESSAWSISFRMSSIDRARNSVIAFEMLVDNDETKEFFSLLNTGTFFNLLEGSKVVATGKIINILKERD